MCTVLYESIYVISPNKFIIALVLVSLTGLPADVHVIVWTLVSRMAWWQGSRWLVECPGLYECWWLQLHVFLLTCSNMSSYVGKMSAFNIYPCFVTAYCTYVYCTSHATHYLIWNADLPCNWLVCLRRLLQCVDGAAYKRMLSVELHNIIQ